MGRKVYLLSGEGNATAALVAGTVSNVAVVTLPSDAGYEFEVSISVSLKLAGTDTTATAQIGGGTFLCDVTSGTAGQIFPIPFVSFGNDTSVSEAIAVQVSAGGGTTTFPASPLTHTITAAPGQAITCPLLSNHTDTYYLHYSYIGRKVIETPVGGF